MEHAADATAAEPDRLSDLPDCLFHIILSLSSMGARHLVQTSALSRRWRQLWRDAPFLCIGPQEFNVDLENGWHRFSTLAHSLMLQHGAVDHDTLRMQVVDPPKYGGCRRRPAGNRWVRRCLARYCPAALVIYNPSPGPHVKLRRMGDGTVLRRLTMLRLTRVTLCAGFEDLLGADGCPRLEYLELRDCLIGFKKVVASGTLKTLAVDSSNPDMNQSSLHICYTPRIVAPGLASLHLVLLRDYAPLWLFQMPSLVEATVRLDRCCILNEFDLLCSLQNVTKLELSSFPAGVMLHRDGRDLPWFHNLTTLVLDECDEGDDVDLLLDFFILFAPNLQKLTLQNCTVGVLAMRAVESGGRQTFGDPLKCC